MNIFDFDGVVSVGVYPGPDDIIITGRTIEEAAIVAAYLTPREIFCPVYFNPITLADRTTGTDRSRTCSGNHKAAIISMLKENGVPIGNVFEDDILQLDILRKIHPDLNYVWLVHELVTM